MKVIVIVIGIVIVIVVIIIIVVVSAINETQTVSYIRVNSFAGSSTVFDLAIV